MNFELLDNPGWHALHGPHQRHMALFGRVSGRFPPDVLMGAAMPDYDQAGFDDLRALVDSGEEIGTISEIFPENLRGWQVAYSGEAPQMVCDDLAFNAEIAAVELGAADVGDMLELVALARPGPFLPRTIELGRYLGVRREGRLVAMAGERLHLPGFCEVSSVCTHPDYRGRGFASSLTTMVARGIMDRGEVPFLHHAPDNDAANRVYTRLGFRTRKRLTLTMLSKAAEETR